MDGKYKDIPELIDPRELFDLDGRIGVILGGAGKMGQQFVRVLTLAGAEVVIADRKETDPVGLAKAIAGNNEVRGIDCDVSDEGQLHALFRFVDEEYSRLDFLIGNVMAKPAGYYRSEDKYRVQTWNEVLQANLTGTYIACKEGIKRMRVQGGGSIVLTSSIYGIVGPDLRIYEASGSNPYSGDDSLTTPAAYAASKGGLVSLAKYIATTEGRSGIRANVLVPGGVFDGQDDNFHQAYCDRVPLDRMAVWSDYNGAILFLVSEASRYMTGTVLTVDGGWTAW